MYTSVTFWHSKYLKHIEIIETDFAQYCTAAW